MDGGEGGQPEESYTIFQNYFRVVMSPRRVSRQA